MWSGALAWPRSAMNLGSARSQAREPGIQVNCHKLAFNYS